MDDSSILLVALTSRGLLDDAVPLKTRDLWAAVQASADRQISPSELFADDSTWRRVLPPDTHELVEARLAIQDHVPGYVEELRRGSIWITTPFEEAWPARLHDRLGAASPLVLYGAGDASLLAKDGIGVVGSRNLSHDGEIVAREIAGAAVAAGLAVVSGAAKGADQIAMSAAMERGGQAVGVLAHPLGRATSDSWIATALEGGTLCLVTPFKPDAGFSVGNAMGRNKLIYALSRATAVVASDDGTGGTWSGAVEALDREFGTVAVWRGSGEGPGNSALGARAGALTFSDTSVMPDLTSNPARQTSLL